MKVRWEKIALAALADAWLAAGSQERRLIVDAAAEIDHLLATAPDESGESRPKAGEFCLSLRSACFLKLVETLFRSSAFGGFVSGQLKYDAVAFDLEQVVLRTGDLLPAFQIAQLPTQLPRH